MRISDWSSDVCSSDLRPADAVETAECWALALAQESRPSLLALTRQNLPPLRHDVTENLCAKGGYRLRDASAARKVVLVATGSEVSLAMEVADKRSEEHTSELQSLMRISYDVFCLKKKKQITYINQVQSQPYNTVRNIYN